LNPVPRQALGGLVSLVFAFANHAGWAQEAAPRELTLAEAVSLALENGEAIRVAHAGLRQAQSESTRARSARLPQAGLSAAYTRTLASEFEDLSFDFGGGADSGLGELPFGQKNRYDLGVQATQTLYAGGRVAGGIGAARASESLASLEVEAARAAVQLEVVAAYFDAGLAEQLVGIAREGLQQAEQTLRQAKAAHEVGSAAEFDVLRAQVAFENERPLLLGRQALHELAIARLRQLLGLPGDTALSLRTRAPQGELFALPEVPPSADELATTRAPVRQAAAQVRLREELLRVARGEALPQVGLNTDYGRVAYPSDGLPGWEETRTNWTVGIGLRVPLLTGGRLGAERAAAHARLDAARAQQDAVRKAAALEAQDTLSQLRVSEETWRTSGGTVEQARRAHAIAEVRYREGISTQLELDDARLLLAQAEVNRAVAARNFELAKARVSLLQELPLGVRSGAFAGSR
jgi:outer membrane protein TolC